VTKKQSILGAAAVYTTANVAVRVVVFAVSVGLTWLLPPDVYGAYGFLVTIVGLLGVLFGLGLDGAAGRWFFDRTPEQHRELVFTLVVTFLVFALSLAVVLDQAGQAWWARAVTELPYEPYGRITLAMGFLTATTAIPLGVLSVQRRTGPASVLQVATALMPTLGIVVVLVAGSRELSHILSGQAAGLLLVGVGALAITLSSAKPRFVRAELPAMLAYSTPLVPHLLAHWVLAASDRYLLQRICDIESVGYYHLAYHIGTVISTVGLALNRAWSPVLTRDLTETDRLEREGHQEGGPSRLLRGEPLQSEPARENWIKVARQTTTVIGAMVFLGVTVMLLGDEGLRMVSRSQYAAAAALGPPIAAGVSAQILYFAPANILFYHRETRLIPFITGTAALVNIGLNLWLIPSMGAMGAALATLVAYLLLTGLTWLAALRVSKMPVVPRYTVLLLLAWFTSVGATLALTLTEPAPLLRWLVKLTILAVFGALLLANPSFRAALRHPLAFIRSSRT
jgi:O-antigen/teichoic acid export membrane protein